MQQAPKIISNHRLARLFLWTRLWLVWFELRFALLGDTPEAREALALETHIARLVRRLARGLTRLLAIPPARATEACASAATPACAHDSS